jgi:hypothetical protein
MGVQASAATAEAQLIALTSQEATEFVTTHVPNNQIKENYSRLKRK